ncbi:hypothetical protein XENORESO_016303, partial [Xenotaenia resolanae]
MDNKEQLGRWLNREYKRHLKDKESWLIKTDEKGLGGRKCKGEAKDAGKRETEWSRLLVWWQGLTHCSKERTQMKQSEKTAVPPLSVPPPYSLTHGIYPVIDVQSGEIYIRGDTESGQLRGHYNPFVPEPSKVYTPQVGGPACYEPFSDRIERDAEAPIQHSPPQHSTPCVYPPPTGERQTLLGNFKEKLSVLKVSVEDGACDSDSQPRQKTRPEAPSSGDRQT